MASQSHSNLDWLQRFYASLCNGDWEHGYGFLIENVDNPGWSFTFDLSDTFLEGQPYEAQTLERSDTDWVLTQVEENRWIGYGGALNLDDIIGLFRKWAEGELTLQRL